MKKLIILAMIAGSVHAERYGNCEIVVNTDEFTDRVSVGFGAEGEGGYIMVIENGGSYFFGIRFNDRPLSVLEEIPAIYRINSAPSRTVKMKYDVTIATAFLLNGSDEVINRLVEAEKEGRLDFIFKMDGYPESFVKADLKGFTQAYGVIRRRTAESSK